MDNIIRALTEPRLALSAIDIMAIIGILILVILLVLLLGACVLFLPLEAEDEHPQQPRDASTPDLNILAAGGTAFLGMAVMVFAAVAGNWTAPQSLDWEGILSKTRDFVAGGLAALAAFFAVLYHEYVGCALAAVPVSLAAICCVGILILAAVLSVIPLSLLGIGILLLKVFGGQTQLEGMTEWLVGVCERNLPIRVTIAVETEEPESERDVAKEKESAVAAASLPYRPKQDVGMPLRLGKIQSSDSPISTPRRQFSLRFPTLDPTFLRHSPSNLAPTSSGARPMHSSTHRCRRTSLQDGNLTMMPAWPLQRHKNQNVTSRALRNCIPPSSSPLAARTTPHPHPRSSPPSSSSHQVPSPNPSSPGPRSCHANRSPAPRVPHPPFRARRGGYSLRDLSSPASLSPSTPTEAKNGDRNKNMPEVPSRSRSYDSRSSVEEEGFEVVEMPSPEEVEERDIA